MKIPQADNVSNVMVDGAMWHARPRDGQAGWADDSGFWIDKGAFALMLDEADAVTFYSPIGRVIEPEE